MNENKLKEILTNHEKWLIGEGGKCANIRYANLEGADLEEANLWYANLEGVYLCGANLEDVNLKGVNLWRANLKGAILNDANLKGANLAYANLKGANLEDVNLEDVNLEDVNLKGANLDFSCLPLWCGSFGAHVDRNIYTQLVYHLTRLIVDDEECRNHQEMSTILANSADVITRHELEKVYIK
jgi:hypothetical protein